MSDSSSMLTLESKLNLKKFDFSDIGSNKMIVIIGKRCSGKTTLILDYLARHNDISNGMIINPTEHDVPEYQDILPPESIYTTPTPEILEAFLERQEHLYRKWKEDSSVDPRAFVVLDNCDAYINVLNSKAVKSFMMNDRCLQTTIIITLQDPVGIPLRLRMNSDYVFICKDTNKQNRKKMYDMYASMFPNFQLFEEMMLQACDRFRYLVLYKNSQSHKLEDQVFWYKANMERAEHYGSDTGETSEHESMEDIEILDQVTNFGYMEYLINLLRFW